MRNPCTLVLAVVLSSALGMCGEPGGPEKEKGPPDAAKQKFKEALSRKISFEFVDTPLEEALAFFRGLAQFNLVLDPRVPKKDAKISLKATDMSLDKALSWVVQLADLKWDVRDGAIYVFDPRQERPGAGKGGPFEEGGPGKMTNMPRLSVKRADGTVIEADMPLLMMPGAGQQILDRALDTTAADDGLLAYRLGRDIAPDADIEKIKWFLTQTVPGAKILLEAELKVLVVTADKPENLRRAAALMRAFRMDQPFGPPFGRPPGDDGDFAVRRKPPFGPDGKPPFGPDGKPPKAQPDPAPGQF